MKIILDCNIWISFLIGHQARLIRQVLTDSRFDVCVCRELIDEIRDVAERSKIRKYVKAKDIADLFDIIRSFCQYEEIQSETLADIRDPKDIYLLSLAEQVGADYLVFGDNDLLDLGNHRKTQIIKLSEFKSMMLY